MAAEQPSTRCALSTEWWRAPRRRLVFDELVGRAADRAAKEAKRAARAAEAFTALLRETKAIAPGMPWEEAHVLVASDRDYQAVGNPCPMTLEPHACMALA